MANPAGYRRDGIGAFEHIAEFWTDLPAFDGRKVGRTLKEASTIASLRGADPGGPLRPALVLMLTNTTLSKVAQAALAARYELKGQPLTTRLRLPLFMAAVRP